MAHEADFCGDRLRLSAFLRVVADGVPKRPTRFKRRTRPVEAVEAAQVSRRDRSVSTGNDISERHICGKSPTDLSVFDVAHSTTPDESFVGTIEDGRSQKDYGRPGPVQITSIRQVENCTAAATAAKSTAKPCKTSSTRRRRRLPVNELVLLRTTSSDGLPRPSDVDQVFTTPVAAVDAIEDNQIVSCAPFSTLPRSRAFHRVQKPNAIIMPQHRSAKNPAFLLQGRPGNSHSTRWNGVRRKLPESGFSTGSDGFVGTELIIQHTKGPLQPRINNTRAKKRASASGELTLSCGHLPAPLAEHHVGALQQSDQTLPHGDHTQTQVQIHRHETKPLSQRALTEIRRAISEREVRERRYDDVQHHENLVRCQLSGITAPARGVSEDSGSEFSNEGHAQSSDEDDAAHGIPLSPHDLSLARVPTSHEVIRCFENAAYNLDAAARSDSCDEEFWSQYPGLESSDGY